MKKILFILPSLNVGGLERVQIALANALVKKGYDVTVMILSDVRPLEKELDSKVKLLYKEAKRHLGNYIPYIRRRFYSDGMWETRASAKTLHRYYVGKEKYDVEVGFFRGMAIKIVSGGSKRSGTKHIGWVHNDFKLVKDYRNNFKSLNDVKKAYSSLDKVVCVSKQAEKSFQEVIKENHNTTTIYNLLPVSEILSKSLAFKVNQGYHKLNTVLVGRLLDSAKGQRRLIRVISKLNQEGMDIGLTIVGAGRDENLIQKEIDACNASDYISMLGNQPNPYPYIASSDLLICASFFEGYNLTVGEALILGVPVLSTDCTGPSEILEQGKYGKLVENSEKGLSDGLREIYQDPNLLNELKKKTHLRKDFFDENRIISQVEEIFE